MPTVLILVPCRNEEVMIPGLCQSLTRLAYPGNRYQIVLINDGSSDNTERVMRRLSAGRSGWHVISLTQNAGKASALNHALSRFPFGEIVYVFDVDHRPEPNILRKAVQYFKDPLVAGVSGFTTPSNSVITPSAYYSMVENYVHQLITMRAKDRLRLAPALLGSNCGYRRSVLINCGGFRDKALLEDSDLTLSIYRAGYCVRFAGDVVAKHQVPESIRGYLNQHTRWSHGFMDVARQHTLDLLIDKRLALPVRIELFLFSLGYLDRLAMAGAAGLSLLSLMNREFLYFPMHWFSLVLLAPLTQVVLLFIEQGMPGAMWIRLPIVPLFYGIDIYAAGVGIIQSVTRQEITWTKTERSQEPD